MIPLFENEIPLFDPAIDQPVPSVTPYLVPNAKACVVVCAGGAYAIRSDYEATPVAKWLNSLGVSAYVLNYRLAPYRYPAPQIDGQRAIRYARHFSGCEKIGMMGFSAGGHLTASVSTSYVNYGFETDDEIDRENPQPDFQILCYPVITFAESYVNTWSRDCLLGEHQPKELLCALSMEKQVNPSTPPAFIWHTSDDDGVPCENSIQYFLALQKHGIPAEMHLFRTGPHGLGLAQEHPTVCQWVPLCTSWMTDLGLTSTAK